MIQSLTWLALRNCCPVVLRIGEKQRVSRFYIRFLLYSTSVIAMFSATFQDNLSLLDWGEGNALH